MYKTASEIGRKSLDRSLGRGVYHLFHLPSPMEQSVLDAATALSGEWTNDTSLDEDELLRLIKQMAGDKTGPLPSGPVMAGGIALLSQQEGVRDLAAYYATESPNLPLPYLGQEQF